MKTKLKHLGLAAMATAAFLLPPAAAMADPIVLTLDPSHTTTVGGPATTFMGSLSNSGAPGRFINNVSFTFSYGGPGTISFDPTAFFAIVPAFLGAGANTGLVSFFDVFADLLVTPGSYTGSFTVLGGSTDLDENPLATQEFVITVAGLSPQAVPEPATLLLLGTGLGGVVLARSCTKRREKLDSGER